MFLDSLMCLFWNAGDALGNRSLNAKLSRRTIVQRVYTEAAKSSWPLALPSSPSVCNQESSEPGLEDGKGRMLDTDRRNETTDQDGVDASTPQPLHKLGIAAGAPTGLGKNYIAAL